MAFAVFQTVFEEKWRGEEERTPVWITNFNAGEKYKRWLFIFVEGSGVLFLEGDSFPPL